MPSAKCCVSEFNFGKEKYFQACRAFQTHTARAARESFGPRSFTAHNFSELWHCPHDAGTQARRGRLCIVEFWRSGRLADFYQLCIERSQRAPTVHTSLNCAESVVRDQAFEREDRAIAYLLRN